MLGGREGSAVALDARQPSLWTSVADRVWLVAVRPRPMCSGSSPWPCGMRHAGLVGTAAWWCGQINAVLRCFIDLGTVSSVVLRCMEA